MLMADESLRALRSWNPARIEFREKGCSAANDACCSTFFHDCEGEGILAWSDPAVKRRHPPTCVGVRHVSGERTGSMFGREIHQHPTERISSIRWLWSY
jgi:hypothetical protein